MCVWRELISQVRFAKLSKTTQHCDMKGWSESQCQYENLKTKLISKVLKCGKERGKVCYNGRIRQQQVAPVC